MPCNHSSSPIAAHSCDKPDVAAISNCRLIASGLELLVSYLPQIWLYQVQIGTSNECVGGCQHAMPHAPNMSQVKTRKLAVLERLFAALIFITFY